MHLLEINIEIYLQIGIDDNDTKQYSIRNWII